MKILHRLVLFINRLNEIIGRLLGWLLVLVVLSVLVIVILRYVFSVGWIWMQESYVWLHAVVFMFGTVYTLLHQGHVRIDLIYRIAGWRYRAVVNIFGCLFLTAPLLWLVFESSIPMVLQSWSHLEKSSEAGGLPGLFLLKSVIPVFAVLFSLQLFSMLLTNILILVTKNRATVPGNDNNDR